MTYGTIQKTIDKAIERFNRRGTSTDKQIYKALVEELKRIDVDRSGRIKSTVANLRAINTIKNKLKGIIISDDYIKDLKQYLSTFNEVTKLQNQYWKTIDSKFRPGPYLQEMRKQAITDTVTLMRETGIAGTAINEIAGLLRTNITTGGSYTELAETLRKNIIVNEKFSRTARQVTVDAINQYNAQYTQVASSDLGFEWFAYRNTTIKTTRPFCFAMTELRYFHITEIPRLLRAEGLTYRNPKTGAREAVRLSPTTDLPVGMIAGTNAANFQINRGGYNCGHQIQPVPDRNVSVERKDQVYATAAYKAWKQAKDN